ncbi:GntR family transcriptional regulator [Mycobacterium sp. NAZ190054]|uniref:GntR family transcriptional regulator n=1 Tax=Mycobacterium sp. NAZ190054 TaxID=1747766 RepID=UPI00079B9B1C|nr:GntR family transcriptional regulator [Mycobacterium sp. NAZ190054]KWX69054.1 hypothetical protein ASJ79_15175 [Mycobacterium sp. NAZ190054]
MAGRSDVDGDSAAATALRAIAESVRGTFQSAETMTKSFIREAIQQGAFEPGERLNLDEIAESLGVSRMPVRASLRQLEGEGLVQISPRRGVTVSVLNAEEIAEIYELRILVETHLLTRVMGALDDAFVDDLEAIARSIDDADDLGAQLEYRYRLFDKLYERADRPRMLALAHSLRESVGRYVRLQRVDEKHTHEALIPFLRAGDAAGATSWLIEHLRKRSARLEEFVARQDGARDDS